MATYPQTVGLERFFPGDSEMARRMRELDWSTTDFGLPDTWPENLRVAVSICLPCRYPIILWWGSRLNILYNDAYLPWLSTNKHPRVLGGPGIECWPELWDEIGPMLEGVRATGKATWSEDRELYFNRRLPREEVYITFTYAPILGANGRTAEGVFCPCLETTGQVVGARRLETLRKLGLRSPERRTIETACEHASAVLRENRRDIAFAAIYLLDATGSEAHIAAEVAPDGDPYLPRSVFLAQDDSLSPWPLAAVLRRQSPLEIEDLGTRGVHVTAAPWPEPVARAVVLPIYAGLEIPAGLLVAGAGSRRPWDASYRTFFDLVARHIGTAIADATAHEQERRRAEALAELDRAKTTFFSNVSHEFRTPLTLALGPIEEILSRSGEGHVIEVERSELDLIHRNGLRLLRLVNTLLDFSRIEAGKESASFEPVDVSTYTAELASVFRSAVEKAGMRLTIDCPPLGKPVSVDRNMWEKIVMNLLSNAFRFTFEGEIRVSIAEAGGMTELSVRDTGTGIPEHELAHIFERFHRVEGARSRSFEGSGIGLSLVQELVRLHRGNIRVESALGRGSCFTVAIPRNGAQPACADLPSAHSPSDRPRSPKQSATAMQPRAWVEEAMRWLPGALVPEPDTDLESQTESASLDAPRILFADDNADLREYVHRLLGGSYKVELANDGETALAAALDNPPDLLLADVMMPRTDGFKLLKAWRDHPRLHSIPVVLLSARAGEESRIEGLAAGATDYLVKPFSARELRARVKSCLEIAYEGREMLQRERELRQDAESMEMGTRAELMVELAAMKRLHEFSTRLLTTTDLQALLEEVLDATIDLQRADFGTLQIYDPGSNSLEIVAQRGFDADFLDHFSRVEDDGSACGRAMHQRERIVVEDVGADAGFAPRRNIAAASGYRAVQSTPLFGRDGQLLGMLSTHFREPHRPSERELHFTDLYAHLAVEAIERRHAEEEIDSLRRRVELERDYLRQEVNESQAFGEIIGSSDALQRVLRQIELVAPTDAAMLIQGETGTGKELIARAVHDRSSRRNRPLVKVNCGSIPRDLFESEFFGHVKGAFTGAIRDRVGRFELADGGTLFLDEVSEIPPELQSKLLRVLQEGEFERVGDEATRQVNVRVIAATNRDLLNEVKAGRFRLDLFYRIGVFPLEVPPLRDRREDIPTLAARFVEQVSSRSNLPRPRLSCRDVATLQRYDWPGNVRELQNVIERAVILARGGLLKIDLPPSPATPQLQAGPLPADEHTDVLTEGEWRNKERENLQRAILRARGRIYGPGGAAAILGIHPNTLVYRLKALGLHKTASQNK